MILAKLLNSSVIIPTGFGTSPVDHLPEQGASTMPRNMYTPVPQHHRLQRPQQHII